MTHCRRGKRLSGEEQQARPCRGMLIANDIGDFGNECQSKTPLAFGADYDTRPASAPAARLIASTEIARETSAKPGSGPNTGAGFGR